MIKTQIPGWGELAIENLILDFNGTIAKDGRVLDGVKELLEKIHDQGVTIYIVTADTTGTVMEAVSYTHLLPGNYSMTSNPKASMASANVSRSRPAPSTTTEPSAAQALTAVTPGREESFSTTLASHFAQAMPSVINLISIMMTSC